VNHRWVTGKKLATAFFLLHGIRRSATAKLFLSGVRVSYPPSQDRMENCRYSNEQRREVVRKWADLQRYKHE
jgi:hypothetical protein